MNMLIKTDIKAEPDQINKFLNTIFKHCALNEGYVALRAFAHESQQPTHQEWRKFDVSLPERVTTVATMVAHFLQSEKSSVFCPPVCLFSLPTKAIEDNVLCAPAITVELDSNPTDALDTLRAILGEPTCIVASGGTWEGQDKLHLHWRLERPATGPDLPMLKLVRRFAASIVKADMTAVPVVHPLRWPGSWHTKGEPRLCRIIGGDEHRDVNLYDAYAQLSEIAAQMDIEGLSEEVNVEGFKTDDPWTADALNAAAELIANESDWNGWNRLGMATYDASHGSEDGRAAFHTISAKHDKYDPGTTDARWDHYHRSPPTRTSAGTLIYEARKVDPDFHKRVGDPSIYFETSPPSSENLSKSLSNKDAKPSNADKRFTFTSFSVAASTALQSASRPLVKGLLDQNAMSILYGESNTGKTFVAMDIAYCVARARPWSDMKVSGFPVLYVAAEGGAGARKRAAALAQRYGDAPDFHFLMEPINLLKADADLEPLLATIRDSGLVFGLIVIDTLSRAMSGGNENDSSDMGAMVKHLDRLRTVTGAHLMAVHHSGKDRAKGARGHSLLRAATDTEIEIADRQITVTKQRDMDGEFTKAFGLSVVDLGKDLEGDAVTSCVVVFDAVEVAKKTDPTEREKEVLAVMDEMADLTDLPETGFTVSEITSFMNGKGYKLSVENVRYFLRELHGKGYTNRIGRGKWAKKAEEKASSVSDAKQFIETYMEETEEETEENAFQ